MDNLFVLSVPTGHSIPATIEQIKRFFKTGENRATVLRCIEIPVQVAERHVSEQLQVLRETILTEVQNNQHKYKITVWVNGTEHGIN